MRAPRFAAIIFPRMRNDFRRAAIIGIVGFLVANALFWALSLPETKRLHGHVPRQPLGLDKWWDQV